MLMEMGALVESVDPNQGHIALAELEKLGIIKMVITQNVDSLHQRAGVPMSWSFTEISEECTATDV